MPEPSPLALLSGLPLFAAYFAVAAALLAACVAIYVRITPYPEFRLIRDGNAAAAASVAGALLGFAMPLASAVVHSVSLLDMAMWAAVALAVQLAVYAVAHRLLPHLPAAVAEGQVASGVFLGALSVSIGLINAACLSD